MAVPGHWREAKNAVMGKSNRSGWPVPVRHCSACVFCQVRMYKNSVFDHFVQTTTALVCAGIFMYEKPALDNENSSRALIYIEI